MLARYIVIAIYGLDAFFGKDAIYLVYDIKNNCVCNYFESDSEAFLCCDELNKKRSSLPYYYRNNGDI